MAAPALSSSQVKGNSRLRVCLNWTGRNRDAIITAAQALIMLAAIWKISLIISDTYRDARHIMSLWSRAENGPAGAFLALWNFGQYAARPLCIAAVLVWWLGKTRMSAK
jgi:multidrug efflux pump subunit AcrB